MTADDSGALSPKDLLWYYIEVDHADESDPVKQRGPFAINELRELWTKKKIETETYVWADGMDDFQQVKSLNALRLELTEPPSSLNPKLSNLKLNLKRATWYYLDKKGTKHGPSILDTLKIMWDFTEVDEDTMVRTEGMDEFAPIRDVPPLFKVLAMGTADQLDLGDTDSEADTVDGDREIRLGPPPPSSASETPFDQASANK
ncbi:hypothetical protein CYMTET_11004, partial [Cymbomonas tetramitiformis]